jgi:hypothetical protein
MLHLLFFPGLSVFRLLILAVTVFIVWMLIDAIVSPNITGVEKLVWVLVIFFIPCLGALLYLLVGRRRQPV